MADPADEEKLVSRAVDNIESVTTRNGKIANVLRAPLMEDHAFARAAFTEYPRGLEYIAYNDSTGLESMHVVADYALHWTDRDLYELKGNVVVAGEENRKLYTQQLYWDVKLKKIYSNVDSKLVEGEYELTGQRFESDDDFERPKFYNFSGTVGVDVEPGEQAEPSGGEPAEGGSTEGELAEGGAGGEPVADPEAVQAVRVAEGVERVPNEATGRMQTETTERVPLEASDLVPLETATKFIPES